MADEKDVPRVAIETIPFGVPNFVLLKFPVEAGRPIRPVESVHLREVEADTLAKMADQWRVELFAKAGKQDPKVAG